MSKRRNRARKNRAPQPYVPDPNRSPRILVLEGLSGSSRCVTQAGGTGLKVSPTSGSLKTYTMITEEHWDALLLTGGSDIDPRLYGEKKINKMTYGINQVRDKVEVDALREARKRGVPVLGICRGAQMINVEAGGTLKQHIGRKHRSSEHSVVPEEGSVFAKAAGERPWVISLHHQAVRDVAPGFRLTGKAGFDGMPEVVESDDGRVLGVQFHPEMDEYEDYSRGIFRWLVEEAARRAGTPIPEWPKKPAKKFMYSGWRPSQSRLGWDDDGWGDWDLESLPGATGSYDADDDVLGEPEVGERGERVAAKRRPAGTRTMPRSPVTTKWQCRCHRIIFNKKQDWIDHEAMFLKDEKPSTALVLAKKSGTTENK